MTRQELRDGISQILVKWAMPTRQVAINEIMNLFDRFEGGEDTMAKGKNKAKKEVKKVKKATNKKK